MGNIRVGFYVLLLALAVILFFMSLGHSTDTGQWENTDPAVRAWFESLLQPDTITVTNGKLNGTSCCGASDAYWVNVSVEQGSWAGGSQIVAVIDDDREDLPLGRMHEQNGTRYIVPPGKIVGERQRVGNPTGRAVLFLGVKVWHSQEMPRPVLCFVDDADG